MATSKAKDVERAELHARARAFIEESEKGEPRESFDALGHAILCHQAEHVAAYGRLLAAQGIRLSEVLEVARLPAVPTDAFRLARIAAHPEAEDEIVFRTSGTTGGARGAHAMRTTKTYELAALTWGKWGLFFDAPLELEAIVLAPTFRRAHGASDSSLGFMMQLFAERWATQAHYLQAAPDAPLDVEALRKTCARAAEQGRPVIVMGTSFAFVHVLDALRGARLPLPEGSRAMHTGGFKGKSREVLPAVLRAEIAAAFGLDERSVVGEYGMTELSSQLYEPTLRARHGLAPATARHGLFVPPPWMRVRAVDPETLGPVLAGEVGILRFEDLANVDSALAIQTADLGRVTSDGVELLGRAQGAPPRGCSLAIDELLQAT